LLVIEIAKLEGKDGAIGVHGQSLIEDGTDMGITEREADGKQERIGGQEKLLQAFKESGIGLLLGQIVLEVIGIDEVRCATFLAAHDGTSLEFPADRAVQLPKSRPARRKIVAGDGDGIEKRRVAAGEAVEIRSFDALEGFFEQEIVVGRENFDGVSAKRAAEYPL
jgi:hypothetical protein